jgi:hypothetical protein
VLNGIHQNIYEYCDEARSIVQIKKWLKKNYQKNLSEDQIKNILDNYVERKLMIQEGDKYLSLAILTYVPEFESQIISDNIKVNIDQKDNVIIPK